MFLIINYTFIFKDVMWQHYKPNHIKIIIYALRDLINKNLNKTKKSPSTKKP